MFLGTQVDVCNGVLGLLDLAHRSCFVCLLKLRFVTNECMQTGRITAADSLGNAFTLSADNISFDPNGLNIDADGVAQAITCTNEKGEGLAT